MFALQNGHGTGPEMPALVMQIAKAATDEGNEDVAHEVVARIPALADYRAAHGDTRLLETLERAEFKITGDPPTAHKTWHALRADMLQRLKLLSCTKSMLFSEDCVWQLLFSPGFADLP